MLRFLVRDDRSIMCRQKCVKISSVEVGQHAAGEIRGIVAGLLFLTLEERGVCRRGCWFYF